MTRRRRLTAIASAALACALPAGAENHVITITDAGFVPADTVIEIGDTVTFQKGATALAHNVVSQSYLPAGACGPFSHSCFRCGAGNGCEGQGASGNPTTDAFSFTLDLWRQVSTDPVYCEVHGGPLSGERGRIFINSPLCIDSDTEVCLLDRFLARIHWERPNNQGEGDARVIKLTDSVAAFEFFEPGNVEVVLKMKDACALPPGNPLRNFWPFVAGLTNVRVELTIIDTEAQIARHFYNALGQPFFTPAVDSPHGLSSPPGAIQATTVALGAFPTCDF